MVPIMLRGTHRSDPLARVDILLGHSLLEVRPCRTEAERLSAWTDHPKRVAITEWDSDLLIINPDSFPLGPDRHREPVARPA